MADNKSGSELLAEIYRNTHYALQSISDIMPETEDAQLFEQLKQMRDGYERISGKAALLAKDAALELKEPSPIKKVMMWGSVKLNALKDNTRAHIAEMLTQGTVMGITALARSIGDSKDCADEDTLALANELLDMEQKYEKKLKSFL